MFTAARGSRASADLSIARQCELLGLSRSGYYYQPTGENELNLLLMQLIDKEYTQHPFFGYRKMVPVLREEGYWVNKKRVARLMQVMGLQAMVPGPNTSRPRPQNPVYPYRLRGVKIAARQSGVELRHHLYSLTERICVPVCHYRLV